MSQLSGFAKKLVAREVLTEVQAEKVAEQAIERKQSLIRAIVTQKLVPAAVIAEIAAEEFGLPYFDITAFDLDKICTTTIKSEAVDNGSALLLYQSGEKLFVALSDPSNLQIIEDVKFQTGSYPEAVIVDDDKLIDISSNIATHDELIDLEDVDDEALESLDITSGDEPTAEEDDSGADDAPIVRFVNKMMLDAIQIGASDIHFEPYEKTYRVRFRHDGILREHAKPPVTLGNRLATRIKVMAQLDISERRVPQDGRFKMRITKQRNIDFRVSSCPTLHGEKLVMRILDPSSTQIGIDSLGYEPFQKEIFMRNINKSQGMVLATGPTGSGKTVSLYTALNILNIPDRNISTAEDPVEINMPGINQVNVNNKAGLDFQTALRAFLRQDPDVIMVGEIRDLETAEIAVKAAQTGHMVLSTLHTNTAAETLSRLISMGVPSFNIAGSVALIIAQRLCRVLCNRCKKPSDLPKPALIEAGFSEEEVEKGEITVFEAVGCSHCYEGFRGRTGIYETLEITKPIAEIILNNGTAIDIQNEAKREGIWNLREAGLHKVKQGITTISEIFRVTND